jgi:hypothetical protein
MMNLRVYYIEVNPMVDGQSRVVFMASSRKEAKLRVSEIEQKYSVKAISNPKLQTP